MRIDNVIIELNSPLVIVAGKVDYEHLRCLDGSHGNATIHMICGTILFGYSLKAKFLHSVKALRMIWLGT